jgi:hypothetical protein
MEIQILCGCGWGDLRYSVEPGDVPTCPDCGFEFPMVVDEGSTTVAVLSGLSKYIAETEGA